MLSRARELLASPVATPRALMSTSFGPSSILTGLPDLVIACAGLAWQAAAFADDPQSAVERQTRFGPIVGSDDSDTTGTYAWKGVPFAKAPVGDQRWKAPVDPEGWKKPRKTQQFGEPTRSGPHRTNPERSGATQTIPSWGFGSRVPGWRKPVLRSSGRSMRRSSHARI